MKSVLKLRFTSVTEGKRGGIQWGGINLNAACRVKLISLFVKLIEGW